MKLLGWLLFPFSLLYTWMMRVRNSQYDSGRRPITNFDRVVISVGNLSVGGTGKTPVIEYLIHLLRKDYHLATISRGYGRRTTGFRLVEEKDDARSVGDEPLQFYRKYGDQVAVAVGEERILAIPFVLLERPEVNIFLLDDAFQHRKVGRDLNIMLSDYSRPFYKDYVLPTGRLREQRSGAGRADCIIITKCPSITQEEKEEITAQIKVYNSFAPIYFSNIDYGDSEPVFSNENRSISENVILLTALANASVFKEYIQSKYELVHHFDFNDHHQFSRSDLDRMLKKVNSLGISVSILTSEKDMVRLLKLGDHDLFKSCSTFYMPIEFKIDREEHFREIVMNAVQTKKAELN